MEHQKPRARRKNLVAFACLLTAFDQMTSTIAAIKTTACLLESLPNECFHHVCLYVTLADLATLSACSQTTAALSGHNELWNLLLCQRLWTVDPSQVLDESILVNNDDNTTISETERFTQHHQVDWKAQFKILRYKEQQFQAYLDNLKSRNVHGWLERHFIGQLAPQWNGWEARYWTWNSQTSSFCAWESERRVNCFAEFPLRKNCEVRRVSAQEQIDLTRDTQNPVREPKPHVFTISNTSFPMLWACQDQEQLQLWLDKISVTLHPLKFGRRTYQAPAKYLMQQKK